jgi:hypothetical protein
MEEREEGGCLRGSTLGCKASPFLDTPPTLLSLLSFFPLSLSSAFLSLFSQLFRHFSVFSPFPEF